MRSFDVMIIGGGYAGVMCALRLAGRSRNKIKIGLANPATNFIERLRIHENLVAELQQPFRTFEYNSFFINKSIEYIEGSLCGIDADKCEVEVRLKETVAQIRYKHLVIATGSKSNTDCLPGQKKHCYNLQSNSEKGVEELRNWINSSNPTRITVLGAGPTGIEVAAELSRIDNCNIQLCESGRFGDFTTQKLTEILLKKMQKKGIDIRENCTVIEVHEDRISTQNGEITHDICVSCLGFIGQNIVRKLPLDVTTNGRILTDGYLRTFDHSNIYAVGDACMPILGKSAPARMSVMFALATGAHAADNIHNTMRHGDLRKFGFWTYGQAIGLADEAVGFGNMRYDVPYRPFFTGRTGHHLRNFFVSLLFKLLLLERNFPGLPFYLGCPAKQKTKVSESYHIGDKC